MDEETKAAIIRLSREAAENAPDEANRLAAALTGGVPVYRAWTGVLWG
jgi:hypothetical protein